MSRSRNASRRAKEIALQVAEERRARIAAEPDSADKRQRLEEIDLKISELRGQIRVLSR